MGQATNANATLNKTVTLNGLVLIAERACPYDKAWIGYVANSNDVHPKVECSNKGQCDRSTGECACFDGYEGVACERTSCPNSCSNAGFCYTQYQLALSASKTYETPWDA